MGYGPLFKGTPFFVKKMHFFQMLKAHPNRNKIQLFELYSSRVAFCLYSEFLKTGQSGISRSLGSFVSGTPIFTLWKVCQML